MTARERLNAWLDETAWVTTDPQVSGTAMRWAPEEPPKPEPIEYDGWWMGGVY